MGGDNAADSFFTNPPPAQPAAALVDDVFDGVDLDQSFTMLAEDSAPTTTAHASAGKQLTAQLITGAGVNAAATTGWSFVAPEHAGGGRKSNGTLLVADSDEED